MALSGSVAVRATTQNNLIFSWAAVQSTAQNCSTVSWQLLLEAKQYGQIIATPGSAWSVTVDGKTVTGTTSLAIGNSQTKVLASGQVKLEHDTLGKRSFDFAFSQEFWITFDGEYIPVVSGSGSAELDAIPRASVPTLSAEAVALGESLTIYTNGVSSFTHTLEYSFGTVSGVVARGVADACRWVPDMALAAQMPDSVSGTAVLKCTTYAGDTPIGTKQVQVTLTVPESVVPTASAVWTDTSGAYDQVGVPVQNVSRLAVEVSGTGAYGATVTGAAVTLDGKAYGGGTLTDSGERSLRVTVTDSRGRVGAREYPLTVAAYSVPVLWLSASRCDERGDPDDTGGFARITVTGHVTDISGRNAGTLDVSWGAGAERVSLGAGDVAHEKTIEADVNDTVTITAVLTDALASASRTMVLSTGYATLDLLAGGRGISLGKAATMEGFDCAMKAYFRGGLFEIHSDGSVDARSLFDRVAALEAKL